MGLQSAMTTALTGLQAAETSIDVIGNNVANSNTVGFKSSEVVFATQFLQTQSIGSAPSDTNGGTNPRQIGLGVKVSQITPNFSQGTIEISSNALDVAIQGDGFLVVQGGQGQPLYTRNGQLSLNSLNQVVTSTGNLVLGYGVNDEYELQTATTQPLTIPLGGERVAQSTSEAVFEGVLNPTVNVANDPGITTSQTLGDASIDPPGPVDGDINSGLVASAAFREAPTAGTATLNGTGTLTEGVYQYRVAWFDVDGNETSLSPVWEEEIPVGTTGSIDLTLPTLPTDGNYASWVLYRTEADGTEFFQHATPSAATLNDDAVSNTATPMVDTAVDGGSYSYYFTYYDENSTPRESRPSAQIEGVSATDSDGSIRLDLSNLAIPDPESTGGNFTEIRIYRNGTGNSSDFFLLDEVALGTNSYIDTTPSSTLRLNDPLDRDGPRILAGATVVDIQTRAGDTYSKPFDLDGAESATLTFSADQAGSNLDPQQLTITASTTVQTLVDFMTDAMGLQNDSNVPDVPLPTDPTEGSGGVIRIENGQIIVTSNYGEQNEIEIPLTAFTLQKEGSEVVDPVNIVFSESQAADGPGTTTEFLVYDSLGSPLKVRLTTVLEASDSTTTTYRWYANSGDSSPTLPDQTTVVGNGLMRFNSQGDLISSPSDRIRIFREATASESPLEVALNFDQVKALAETNSSGEPISSFNMTSQNGFPPGVLTDFLVTESGLIQGQFSNGTQRDLGQLVMARFSNNQGLSQVGDSLFARSVNSGEPILGNPGQDGLGSITAGAVELSNTDIGQDLVEMILAQTQYQAGSRVISAAQELLDELLALNR